MQSQDQEQPHREHAVLAILSSIYMVPEETERGISERGAMMEAMIGFAYRAWGWNVQKFREELDACKKMAEDSRGQLVTGFGPEGFEFEFRLPK